MEALIIILAVALSGIIEYLAAAVIHLPLAVVSALAEEGSSTGINLKRAIDDPNETRLALSLVDGLVLIIAGTILAIKIVLDPDIVFVEQYLLEIAILQVGVMIVKVIASAVGERTVDRALQFVGAGVRTVSIFATPFVWAHRALLALTKPRTREEEEEEAREELEALVETAREEGALDAGEYRIMTNIMRLSSIEVSDVMTPRTVVSSLNAEQTVEDVIKHPELQMFSRMPVYDGADLDAVVGYVMTKDILRAALAGRNSVQLAKLKRDVSFIPENISLDQALEQFLQKRQHVFMVVDEYGGVEGLITMEDVLETMLGAEIIDEADHVVDLRALAKQRRDARIAQYAQGT
jgi:CBS domain containing-hemolysin-like protein